MTHALPEHLIWEHTPPDIVAQLPHVAYEIDRQPTYSDEHALQQALAEVQSIRPVTMPERILALRHRLGEIALGHSDAVVVIQGNCDEPVGICAPNDLAADMIARRRAVAQSALGNDVLLIERALGQNTKPRTSGTETVGDQTIPAYMGGMVNGKAVDDREPNPVRMVRAARQAHEVQAILETSAELVPSAHEALLLPFELSRLACDERTGERYLLSADVPWIGDRTSDPDGQHVALLRGIENPVGIKVGDRTTPETVARWVEQLDPDHIPGKLVFMLRISPDRPDVLNQTLEAIKSHAPHAVLIYDIHASTKSIDGHKIRAVSNIVADIRSLERACEEHGLQLHGVHLEAMSNDEQRQCVEHEVERPTHPPSVDPQLNLQQLTHVLDDVASCLQRRGALV